MHIYLAIFCFNWVLFMLEQINKDKFQKFMIWIFLFVMVIFVGFRYELAGFDYFVYQRQFENTVTLRDLSWVTWENSNFYGYEAGFHSLTIIGKSIIDNFNIFLFLVSLITLIPITFLIRKYSPSVFLPFIIYLYKGFFYYNFTAIRQLIAMTIFYYALRFLFEKQYKRYLLFIVLASLFHGSALFLVLLIPIVNMKINKRKMTKIILTSTLLGFFPSGVAVIYNLIVRINTLLGLDRFNIYFLYNSRPLNILNLFESLAIFVGIYLVFDRMWRFKYFQQFLNLFICYYVLLTTFQSIEAMTRIRDYFLFSFWIIITYIAYSIENKWLRATVIFSVIVFSLIGYIRYLIVFDEGDMLLYRNYLFLNN